MPVYNAGQFIEQAVCSVLAQSYPNWELVVVDDGSMDDTPTRLAQFTDRRIRVLRQANAGEAAARNFALGAVSGELLAFLDADDAFLPEHLALTVDYLQAHPDLGGVYTDGYHIDQQGERGQPLSSRRRGPFQGWIFEELVRASDVFGPPLCVVLRRKPVVVNDLRFDPQIVIGPDWDFFTRFSEFTRFGFLQQKTCLYRLHPSNISRTAGSLRRSQDRARCRQKALSLQSFGRCNPNVRAAVFYDLLLELFAGQVMRQAELVAHPEFAQLPAAQQARLLRLLAVQVLTSDQPPALAGTWLRQAVQVHPADWRARLLLLLFSISPALLAFMLRLRRQPQPASAA